MLSSSKFWVPIGISVVITVFAVLYAAIMLMAAGAHARQNPSTGIGTLAFPYSALVDGVPGGFGLALVLLTFLGQFPLYGIVAGHANFKGRVKPVLLAIVGSHLLVYFLVTYLAR